MLLTISNRLYHMLPKPHVIPNPDLLYWQSHYDIPLNYINNLTYFNAPGIETDWLLEKFQNQLYVRYRVIEHKQYSEISFMDEIFIGNITIEQYMERNSLENFCMSCQ